MLVKMNLQRLPLTSKSRVAMILLTEDNQTLVHKKWYYPEDVFRLPTGTIEKGESPEDALVRETEEEFGIKLKKGDYKKIDEINYYLNFKGQTYKYKEIIYLIKKKKSEIKPNERELGEYKFIPIDDLIEIYRKLKWIKGGWKYWGKFRSILHRVVYNLYKEGKLQ